MPPAPGYDSIPGMNPYPGAPGYAASLPYPGQYPYGSSQRSIGHPGPGMTGPGGMVGPMMDGYLEGVRGAGATQGMPSGGGGMMNYPGPWAADPSRRSSGPPGMNRGWGQVRRSLLDFSTVSPLEYKHEHTSPHNVGS